MPRFLWLTVFSERLLNNYVETEKKIQRQMIDDLQSKLGLIMTQKLANFLQTFPSQKEIIFNRKLTFPFKVLGFQ